MTNDFINGLHRVTHVVVFIEVVLYILYNSYIEAEEHTFFTYVGTDSFYQLIQLKKKKQFKLLFQTLNGTKRPFELDRCSHFSFVSEQTLFGRIGKNRCEWPASSKRYSRYRYKIECRYCFYVWVPARDIIARYLKAFYKKKNLLKSYWRYTPLRIVISEDVVFGFKTKNTNTRLHPSGSSKITIYLRTVNSLV